MGLVDKGLCEPDRGQVQRSGTSERRAKLLIVISRGKRVVMPQSWPQSYFEGRGFAA
jgi:hypothetical protein